MPLLACLGRVGPDETRAPSADQLLHHRGLLPGQLRPLGGQREDQRPADEQVVRDLGLNRAASRGPFATAYIDRDGTIVRAIDPVAYAAWSQGDVASLNTKLPTIAAAVASGVNMDEWVHESIECSGSGTEPFTDAQFESVAQLVAAASRALGIPINRSTVVVHAAGAARVLHSARS